MRGLYIYGGYYFWAFPNKEGHSVVSLHLDHKDEDEAFQNRLLRKFARFHKKAILSWTRYHEGPLLITTMVPLDSEAAVAKLNQMAAVVS